MTLNAGIILSGQQAQPVDAFFNGQQAGYQALDRSRDNALRAFIGESGADVLAGQPNALNALAGYGPEGLNAAQGIQQQGVDNQRADTRLGMDQQRLEMDQQAVERQIEAQAQAMGQAAAAAELDQARRAFLVWERLPPEQRDAWAQANGVEEFVGQDPESVRGILLTTEQVVERMEGQGGNGFDADRYRNVDGTLVDLQAEGGPTAVDLGGPAAPTGFDTGETSDLRGEFNGLATVKAFSEQSQAFGRIVASARDPSPAGDLALIFNYMKVLDPGSVVRESEFATAASASAWLQESEQAGLTVPRPIAQAIRSMATGERLSDEQRGDFVRTAGALYQEAERNHERIVAQYTGVAGTVNADPDAAIIDYRFRESGAPLLQTGRPQARPGVAQQPIPQQQAQQPVQPQQQSQQPSAVPDWATRMTPAQVQSMDTNSFQHIAGVLAQVPPDELARVLPREVLDALIARGAQNGGQ